MQHSFPSTIGGSMAPITKADIQVYTADNQGQGWTQWIKPPGITMCYMVAIAGGGGGGGGFTLTTTSAGGGAGGACSGISRLLIPSFLLPDILYVQVGQGGYGGAAGSAGITGANTYISVGHSSALPNVVLASGVNAPGGGAAGTAAAGGTGGTVPTIATNGTGQFIGLWQSTVGLVGAAGGAGTTPAAGTSVTAWAALPLSPGAGGGGCSTASANFPGGVQTATAAVDFGNVLIATTAGFLAQSGSISASGSAAVGGNGSSGFMSWKPFFMTGGAGGSSSNGVNEVGGAGGRGGIGCGGGGGGSGKTGGRGGNGGPGMALIVSW